MLWTGVLAIRSQVSNVEGLSWPPVSREGKAAVTALIADLEETQWLTPEEIAEKQALQLGVLSHYHKTHTPSFAARLKAASVEKLDSLAKLRQIEPLSRHAVQTLGEDLFSDEVPFRHLPVRSLKTSGSTGELLSIKRTAISQLFWSAYGIRDHMWFERDFNLRMSAIRLGVTEYVELANWGKPAGELYETGGAQGIPLTTDIKEQLRLLRLFRPEILIVYPNVLAAFVSIWEKEGFDLRELRHIKTIGETVRPELRARTAKITSLRIEDTYSSQEAGIIAIQCPMSGLYHVMSECLIVEVLNAQGEPCRTGETGRVVVSDLNNLATPLIRYDIGDYAEVGPQCGCGRGLPTLKRILGRERNLVRLPNGSRFWPVVGYHHYEKVAPVRQYQLVQTAIDEMEFKVVTDEPITRSQEEGFIEIIQRSMNYPFKIKVTQSRDRLPAGPGGKFEDFVCRVV